MDNFKRATIDAENTFSDPLRVGSDITFGGSRKFVFAKAIMTDGATVSVQMKRPDESTYITVQEITTSDVFTGEVVGAWDMRVGVETGNFVSDDVQVEVGIG